MIKKDLLRLAIVLAIIAVLVLIAKSPYALGASVDPDTCMKFPATLIKVTDGDTIQVNLHLGFGVALEKEKIRMYGINTPESRTSNPAEKVAGLAAKARLQEMLASKDLEICVDRKKPRGKFGRVIGIVFAEGKNVNDRLIAEGHAIPYFGGKRKEYNPEDYKTSLDLTNLRTPPLNPDVWDRIRMLGYMN